MGCACPPGPVLRCLELCVCQWWVQWGVCLGGWCAKRLSLAHCSSSWCWKHFRASSALVYHGSSCMLRTWCSSWTPRKSISQSLRRGRRVFKVKGSMSTSRRPSSQSLLLTLMSSRNPASIPVLSAAMVLASACCGSTRGAAASLSDWWPTHTTSAPDVMARLGHQWQNSDLSACRQHHAWCGGHFLLPRWHAVLQWRLWQWHCCQV